MLRAKRYVNRRFCSTNDIPHNALAALTDIALQSQHGTSLSPLHPGDCTAGVCFGRTRLLVDLNT